MSARDDLLAELEAERYAPRPRPFDTIAAVQHVERVQWGRAYDLVEERRAVAERVAAWEDESGETT